MFQKITLNKGLRLLLVPTKNTKAITILILVATGSKYETSKNNGISHFLEHLFFKGTKKMPNCFSLAKTIDSIGGAYNAFTSKEYTGFWVKASYQHFKLALEWIADIFCHSQFPVNEIEREKGVILEEIKMYNDSPKEYIATVFEKLLYNNQPAGFDILGKKENILKFSRKDFVNYFKTHYLQKNTIVCIAGNINIIKRKKIEKEIENYFKEVRDSCLPQKKKVIERQKKAQVLVHFKKTDQVHLSLGVRGYNIFNKEKTAQFLLSIILGGNMSSRLFIKIRERKGYAYYIYTASEFFTDSGYLTTYAGVDLKNLKESIKLILEEYQNLRKKIISEEELNRAKEYLKGHLTLSLESTDAKASFYATQELLEGKIITLEEKFKQIEKVKPKDIQNIAKDIFKAQKLNLALIGAVKDKASLEKILAKF